MTTTPLTKALLQRDELERQYRTAANAGDDVLASFRRLSLDEADREVRSLAPDGFDIRFRQMLASKRDYDAPYEARAIGATARGLISGTSFVETFSGAMAAAAPLLELANVVNTTNGEPVSYSFVATLPTPNGIVADGVTITAADPTFGGGALSAFSYKDLIQLSNEIMSDSVWNVEQWAATQMGPSMAYKLSADLWGGAGSTTAPEGLLAGLSTVTAAGAAIVTFDDVAALLNAVPAAYRYNGRCTVLLSPGAHVDLMEEQPLYNWASGRLFGFPFRVDANLADPATTTKSVVAGDFFSAFVIRLLPLRVGLDSSVGFANDRTSLRVTLRADSRRLVTGAAKALVHP